VGSYAGALRYQLGLKTPPPDSPGECVLRVFVPTPKRPRAWRTEEFRSLHYRDGEDFVFDDNREHYSINSTPYPRLILVVDFPRHDMPVGERVINAAVMRLAAPMSTVVKSTHAEYRKLYQRGRERGPNPALDGVSLEQ